jgi:hypothetical protein
MKKEKLSYDELSLVITKIREEYDRLSAEMDSRLFDRPSFEKRYRDALISKIDVQTFAFAEMSALEDKKKLFEKREREIKIRTEKTYTKKIDKMLEEMAERTRKYPLLYAGSGITEEASHLCGALESLYYENWLPLERVIEKEDSKNRNKYAALSRDFLKFIGKSRTSLPLEVDRYVMEAERNGDDKADRQFLKEAAMLLSSVIALLQDLQDFRMPEDVLEFPGSPDKPSPFNGLARKEAWDIIGKKFSEVINDFRFSELI